MSLISEISLPVEQLDQLLPPGLAHSLQQQIKGEITTIVPRGGGGASRQGAVLTLRLANGELQQGYLSYDPRVGDPQRLDFFTREVSILKALSTEFAGSGIAVPTFIAAVPEHLAILTALVEGDDQFHRATNPEQVGVDFVRQLARLHRLNPALADLKKFGDLALAPSELIRQRIDALRNENMETIPDPLLQLALNWLEKNIPEDQGSAVIVHGDAGPANFMHHNNRVTALLDWELCHLGDPVEDLAQIWVRCLFQPFLPMRQVFDVYEQASGLKVDVDRVRYHRLFFQLGFTVPAHANFYGDFGGKPPMLGLSMLFYTAHIRVIAQSLGELTGQSLVEPQLPECAISIADASFVTALEDLAEVITPRLEDQQAQVKAKSLARLVKWWRKRERFGQAFEQSEINEVNSFLGAQAKSLQEARKVFALAVKEKRVDEREALQLCFNRAYRETELMSDALGKLKNCYFPSVDNN